MPSLKKVQNGAQLIVGDKLNARLNVIESLDALSFDISQCLAIF